MKVTKVSARAVLSYQLVVSKRYPRHGVPFCYIRHGVHELPGMWGSISINAVWGTHLLSVTTGVTRGVCIHYPSHRGINVQYPWGSHT